MPIKCSRVPIALAENYANIYKELMLNKAAVVSNISQWRRQGNFVDGDSIMSYSDVGRCLISWWVSEGESKKSEVRGD